MGREGGVEDWLVNSLSVSRLESKRDRGKKGGAFRSKLMRGLALHRPHTAAHPSKRASWVERDATGGLSGYSKRSGSFLPVNHLVGHSGPLPPFFFCP